MKVPRSVCLAAFMALVLAVPASAAETMAKEEAAKADIRQNAKALLSETQTYSQSLSQHEGIIAPDGDYAAAIAALAEKAAKTSSALRNSHDADEDLACILNGIAQDLPRRYKAVAEAKTPEEQDAALREMSRLLDDSTVIVQ